jgi:eukaryotic-like serine/threonine-protein kinase
MPVTKHCSGCGAEIPPAAPGGLCASCLLAPGLEPALNPEPLEPADLTPILVKTAPPLVVKFHSFGDYELIEEVARGGMGVVFRARQLSLNRIVALKFIHPGRLNSPESMRRFQIEAEATASLDHPNIVPIYEVGEHQGQPFFSMTLMVGGTLADRLENGKSKMAGGTGVASSAASLPYPPSSAAQLLSTMARAVQHAHERGILHRDLKPGNIVFDAQGQPHLTDFGLAKVLATESHLTLTADVLGSPHYMAPEQAEGKRKLLTTATDIYSLGCILYELLVGRPPFQGETPLAILQQVREQEPQSLRGFNPSLDRDLETICLKCLEKDPADRYPSAGELADELDRFLSGRPIVARPQSQIYRFQKLVRRNKLVFAAAIALAVALLAGTVVSMWQAVLARRAQRDTAHQLYVSDMIVAEKALREGNLRRADELLKSHIPNPDAREDLRGFEYYYLLEQCQGEQLFAFPAGENAVFSVAYSPDGKILAMASCYREMRDFSGRLKLFDLATRREVTTLALPSADGIRSVAFSPDGKLLACGSAGSVVGLWDAKAYGLLDSFYAEQAAVANVVFSPNGTLLAGTLFATSRAGVPGRIKIWDMQTRQVVHDFKTRIPRPEALAFSPDGRWLAYVDLVPEERQGFEGMYLQVWRGNSQDESVNVNSLHLWDLETQRTTTNRVSFGSGVSSIQFSPDSKNLAFGASSGLVALWNLERRQAIEVGKHEDAVLSVTFSGDGRLASSSADGTIKLWDLHGKREARVLKGHRDRVKQVVFSPDGTQLASASFDQTVRLWSVAATENNVLRGHVKAVTAVDFHPEGQLLATASSDGTVRIWDILRREVRHTFTNLTNAVLSLAFSPDGRYLATGDAARNISVWQATNWGLTTNLTTYSESNNVSGLRFSSDAKLLFVAESGFVSVWETESWRRVAELAGGSQRSSVVAASSDGALLAVGSDSIQLYEVATWRRRKWLSPGANVGTMSFTPDSKILITGSSDSKVRLWDVTSEKERPEKSLSGQVGGVSALAISPNGKTLAVSDARGAIKLWNLATRKELFTLVAHETSVLSLAFSRDGRTLASGGSDGTVRLWRGGSYEAAHPQAPRP